MEPTEQAVADSKRGGHWYRISALIAVLPALPLAYTYMFRPDSCAALTVWPVCAWSVPGLLIALFSFRRRRWKRSALVAGVWLAFATLLSEEARSLLRFNRLDSAEWVAAGKENRALRVVSLNCAGGSVDAMREVGAFRPDVVLLQESPTEKQVSDFAHELFGPHAGILVGFDASIIAKGTLTPAAQTLGQRAYFVHATVRMEGRPPIEVVSLRLTPACVRTDLYSAAAWRDHSYNRRLRRDQLRAVVTALPGAGMNGSVLVGGDFNAPQGDAVVDLLRPRLRDTFAIAGAGWGDTIINEAPVLRIDQIWVSANLRPTAVVAVRTVHSDHRMVVADLILPVTQVTGQSAANPVH